MSTPYGGTEPPQWGQASQPPAPQPGGFPAAGHPQQPPPYGQQSGQPYGQLAGQWQYGQQQYGQQQPGFGGPSSQQHPYGQPYGQYPLQRFAGQQPVSARKGGKLLWTVIAALVAVVAALGITGFWKPGFFVTRVLDAGAVQDGVRDVLRTYGSPADSVTCPPSQPVKAGTTFTCTAVIGGQRRKVTITVKDEDGKYEVGVPEQ